MCVEGTQWHLGDITWTLSEQLAGSKIKVQETTGAVFMSPLRIDSGQDRGVQRG